MTPTIPSEVSHSHSRLSRVAQRFRDLSVGSKLSIGFGSLVALMLLILLVGFLANNRAKTEFERTRDLRLPSALNSTNIELEIHEMIGNIQAYLSLGEPRFREEFDHDMAEIGELLDTMDALSTDWTNQENKVHLRQLATLFEEWEQLANEMFKLRDSPEHNQPALKIMLEEARPAEYEILGRASILIEMQAARKASPDNMRLLKTLADYRNSFSQMSTAVDGYLASSQPAFKEVYQNALAENEDAWDRLGEDNASLTWDQQKLLIGLTEARQVFTPLPDKMFAAIEGEHTREDLYLMRTQATPLADEIIALVDEIRASQEESLSHDVNNAGELMSIGQMQTLAGAAVSLLLALGLAYAIRRDIAGPVTKLTDITARIMNGDVDARARVESRDEIGRLAQSLNAMTDRMKASLEDAERRAQIIETSSRVSRRLSTILDQEKLVKAVVEQVQSAFDYYYAHIFLMDETHEYLVTAGGAGETGRELVRRGFKIPLDQGLVGRAARTNAPVYISDVSEEDGYLPNSLLPDTKAEIAVPISIGDEVLGVLDVQHNVLAGLSKVDLDMLQAIASQVAVALVNARSYAATQQRAHREMLINEINQKILSTTSVEKAMQVAVREVGRAVKAERATVRLAASSPPVSQRDDGE